MKNFSGIKLKFIQMLAFKWDRQAIYTLLKIMCLMINWNFIPLQWLVGIGKGHVYYLRVLPGCKRSFQKMATKLILKAGIVMMLQPEGWWTTCNRKSTDRPFGVNFPGRHKIIILSADNIAIPEIGIAITRHPYSRPQGERAKSLAWFCTTIGKMLASWH